MPHIRAQVSDDAYDGWREFAGQCGVSMAALIEAVGTRLSELVAEPGYEPSALLAAVLERAKEIDRVRRKRGR